MYWRDVVTLKAVTEGRDADGFPKETITETTVFADVSSTKRSEFYAARQAGISLALTVKLRAADYDGQERLSYEGKEYKVERAYTEAREYYELNCLVLTKKMQACIRCTTMISEKFSAYRNGRSILNSPGKTIPNTLTNSRTV